MQLGHRVRRGEEQQRQRDGAERQQASHRRAASPERWMATALSPRYEDTTAGSAEHRFGGSFADRCPEVHADDAVAELGDERNVVFDDHERGARRVLQLTQQLGERFALTLRDARRRFVEEQDTRFMRHRARNLDNPAGSGR